MFGCLFRIFQGLILVALAGALAYFGVLWVENEFERAENLPVVTKKTVASASVGDPFLVSGKVSKANEVHEKGLVIGQRQVQKQGKIRDESGNVRYVKVWEPKRGFGDRLLVSTNAGVATVAWDGYGDVDIDGTDVDIEEGKKRWVGVKVGTHVTHYATLSAKKPLEFAGSKSLFVGTADRYKASSKESEQQVVWIVYGVAAFIGLIGAGLVLTAPFRRRS